MRFTTNVSRATSNRRRPAPKHCLCRWCGLCEPQSCFSRSGEEHCINMSKTMVPHCQWKTERTSLRRETDRVAEEWRMTKKLGSLLGDAQNVARKKTLLAFHQMWTLWLRCQHVSEALCLRLYNVSLYLSSQHRHLGPNTSQKCAFGLLSLHPTKTSVGNYVAPTHPQCSSVQTLPVWPPQPVLRWLKFDGDYLDMFWGCPEMFQCRWQLTSTFNQLLVCHAGEDNHGLHDQWCSLLTYKTLDTICNCAARLTLSNWDS